MASLVGRRAASWAGIDDKGQRAPAKRKEVHSRGEKSSESHNFSSQGFPSEFS